MSIRKIAALGALGSILSACAGGGTTPAGTPASLPSLSSVSADAAPDAGRGAKLVMRVRIPHRPRHARFISPSTQSVKITEGGKTLGIFNTTPTSKGCLQSNGATSCTFSMGAIPGTNKLFVVDTYDAPGAGDNLLAAGSIAKTIVANQANALNVTLGGVEKALTIGLSESSPVQGTSASITVTVNAQDADGNTIVAPGNYVYPISLADSDASGATQLSSKTIGSPSANTVTLSYNGAAGISATITASAGNASTEIPNATATMTSVKPHSEDVGGVWAATPGYGAIPYYASSATPSLALNGGGITNATQIAVDDTGRVIAGDASGNIELYPLDAVNTATPSESITAAGGAIAALAWDSIDDRIIYAASGSGEFCVVRSGASGAASGVSTCYSSPSYPIAPTISGLAVDPNTGTLYVANSTPVNGGGTTGDCPNGVGGQKCVNILVFSLGADGSYNFSQTYDMQDDVSCQWWNLGQIVWDPAQVNGDGSRGVLWVVDETSGCDNVIGLWQSFSGNNINYYTVTGDGTDLVQPASVALDGSGGLWIGDQSTTWLERWTGVYSSPAQGTSYYLGAHNGGVSPTALAVFNVYAPPASMRRHGKVR